ncbi:MAG: hypothetical protein OHK0017_04570 [Patescibacteria group bacterium]
MSTKKVLVYGVLLIILGSIISSLGYFGFQEYQKFQNKKNIGQSISRNKEILSNNGNQARKTINEITQNLNQASNSENNSQNLLEENLAKLNQLQEVTGKSLSELDKGDNEDTQSVYELGQKILQKRQIVFQNLNKITGDLACVNSALSTSKTNFNSISAELAKIDPADTSKLTDQIKTINQNIDNSISNLAKIKDCSSDSNNPILANTELEKIQRNIDILQKIKDSLSSFSDAFNAKDVKKMDAATKGLKAVDVNQLTTAINAEVELSKFKNEIDELTELEKEFNSKIEEISQKYKL